MSSTPVTHSPDTRSPNTAADRQAVKKKLDAVLSTVSCVEDDDDRSSREKNAHMSAFVTNVSPNEAMRTTAGDEESTTASFPNVDPSAASSPDMPQYHTTADIFLIQVVPSLKLIKTYSAPRSNGSSIDRYTQQESNDFSYCETRLWLPMSQQVDPTDSDGHHYIILNSVIASTNGITL